VRRASGEPAGKLRVDAAPILGEDVLPEIIAGLHRRHPRLEVHVQMSADYIDLRRGKVDVALRASPLDDATDLFAVRLATSVTGCYASKDWLATNGTPMTPSDLSERECILVGSTPTPRWTFRVAGRDERVEVSGRVRVDNFRVARSLAAEGIGVVRLARVFAEPLVRDGTLVPVLERYWPKTPIHAVHAGTSPPAPKVRAFIELARTAVARALAFPA